MLFRVKTQNSFGRGQENFSIVFFFFVNCEENVYCGPFSVNQLTYDFRSVQPLYVKRTQISNIPRKSHVVIIIVNIPGQMRVLIIQLNNKFKVTSESSRNI